MRQKLIDDLASAAWSVLNFDNDPGREPEGPANWKALTSAMERALEKHADRAGEEINVDTQKITRDQVDELISDGTWHFQP